MTKTGISENLDRRTFLAGTGTTALVGAAAMGSLSAPALAEIGVDQHLGSTGLIEIAGRVTNAQGTPHKRAYIKIMHQGRLEWTLDATAGPTHVDAMSGPEHLGVWTDEDGVFRLHAQSPDNGGTAKPARLASTQTEVLFDIKTRDGNHSQWNVLLDADTSATVPASRISTRYVANFSVD